MTISPFYINLNRLEYKDVKSLDFGGIFPNINLNRLEYKGVHPCDDNIHRVNINLNRLEYKVSILIYIQAKHLTNINLNRLEYKEMYFCSFRFWHPPILI